MMGYFSNGTEGECYEEKYCDNCVHQKPDDGGCSVMLAHLMFAYEECGAKSNAETMLNILIPRAEDGLSNKKCTMFHPTTQPLTGDR